MKFNTFYFVSALSLTVFSASSFADNTEIQLAKGTFKAVDRVTGLMTQSETFDIKPAAATATAGGTFLKNTFAFAVSANVKIGVKDNGSVFAAVAGSPSGRNVFSGSTQGGSVSTCGDAVSSSEATATPDTFVVDASLSMTAPGGCARTSSSSSSSSSGSSGSSGSTGG